MDDQELTTPSNQGLTQEVLEAARQSGTPAAADKATKEAKPVEKAKEDDLESEEKEEEESEDADSDDSKDEEEGESKDSEAEDGDDEKPIGLWDKDRQARDQEAANERKALVTQVEEMRSQLAALTAVATKKADKSGDSDDSNRADALADIEKRALALADGINENTDSVAIGKTFKAGLAELFAALKTVKTSYGDSAELKSVKSELEALKGKFSEGEQAQAAKDRASSDQRALEQQDAHIAKLDKKYGGSLHNAAIKRARAKMDEAGFTDKKRPAISTSIAFLDAAYAEIALEKGVKPAAPVKREIRPDPGTGGKAPAKDGIKPGSLASVMSQIRNRKRQ